jgi:hypothetical protein
MNCNEPIADLFAQSIYKAMFYYYCPVDNNVTKLDNNSAMFVAKQTEQEEQEKIPNQC